VIFLKRKLKKLRCPACGFVEPIMELINTVQCLNCKNANVEPVENGYVIIETESYEVIEISKD
jgi:predicted Zn-ribbon and HTH transcriptional regulator